MIRQSEVEADGIVLWRSPVRPGMTEKAVLDYISSIDKPFSSN